MYLAQQANRRTKEIKLLLAAIGIFITYFIYLSVVRHNNFYSRRLDLGNMDQTVWNVANGHGFTLTEPTGDRQESRLAVHADFLLILLAPLYLIWSDPRMLLITQSIILGLGAVPIYLIAEKILQKPRSALLFSLAYLLYPTVQLNVLHDFHAVTLSTTFLLFTYWYLLASKPRQFMLFAILAALCKEQIWLVTAMLGAAWVLKKPYRRFGLIVTGANLAIFYLLLWILIPAVTPDRQHWALTYLSDYGGGLNEILKNLFTNPISVLTTFFLPNRLYYYFQLLSPLAFFSLFAPSALIYALPSLAINSLSNNQLMRMIDYQYTSDITPWIFVSAISGYRVIQKLFSHKIIPPTILVVSIITAVYLWGELPFGRQSRFWFFTSRQPGLAAMQEISRNIPTKYTVSATNNIGAHFSQRQFLYNFPIKANEADYAVAHLGDPYAWPSGESQKAAVQSLLNNENYELITWSGSFFAFKRKKL